MKKRMRSLFRWAKKTLTAITCGLLLLMLLFNVEAALRETQTRSAAAPATGRFVQAGDVELFIQEIGPASGPAVVFIHGAGAWSGLWHDTMTAFAAKGFRCIAIDVPPFGFSQRPTTASFGRVDQARRIIAVLDALHLAKVTLVGHSFGGGATVETALMIPDRIETMVLVDVGGLGIASPALSHNDQPPVWQRVLAARPLRHALVASTITNPLLTKPLLQTLILDPADATAAHIHTLQQPMVLEDSTDTVGDWLFHTLTTQERSLTSDPANYHTLTMPVLLVWGAHDDTVPLADGRYLHSILPRADLAVMPGVDHVPHIEDPAAFNAIVVPFLRQHMY